jgi:hypothetical protein
MPTRTKAHPKAKLTPGAVRKIKKQIAKNVELQRQFSGNKITKARFERGFVSISEIARRNDVSHATIHSIKSGETWKHVTV